MNSLTLDMIGAVLCGITAIALFAIHILTSRRHGTTPVPVPEYVRIGLFATGALFMVRSVNFATLPPPPIEPLGHINPEGVLAAGCLAYLAASVAFWAFMYLRRRREAKINAGAIQADRIIRG